VSNLSLSLPTRLVIATAALAAGCASTQSYAPADHCTTAIPAGMVRVTASRSSSSLGGAVPFGVHDDGQPIGELGPGGRVCWLRHAGTAHVTATIPSRTPHTGRDIDVKLAPGESALLEIALGEQWKLVSVRR
jgi:hypothetical protein